MKRLNNVRRTLMVAIGTGILSVQSAFAQVQDFSATMTSISSELKTGGTVIINVLSILLGIIAAIRLIPIFVKRGKNEGQTSELLTDWGFTLIYVLLGLQIVRLVLLK